MVSNDLVSATQDFHYLLPILWSIYTGNYVHNSRNDHISEKVLCPVFKIAHGKV